MKILLPWANALNLTCNFSLAVVAVSCYLLCYIEMSSSHFTSWPHMLNPLTGGISLKEECLWCFRVFSVLDTWLHSLGSYISVAKNEWHHWIQVFNFLAISLNTSLISLAEHHIHKWWKINTWKGTRCYCFQLLRVGRKCLLNRTSRSLPEVI